MLSAMGGKVLYTCLCLLGCILVGTQGQGIKGMKENRAQGMGCLPGCICGGLNYKVICDFFPKTALPPKTTSFQAKNCPNNVTQEQLLPLKPNFIEKLDLSGCGIEYVADSVLSEFKGLEVVVLSFNHITTIESNTFKFCSQLKEIYLDGNGLKTLGHGCFNKLRNLQVLHLEHNGITIIPALPPSLKSLEISHNQITDLTDFSFQENMVNVDLCNNPLSHIPATCFARATKLQSLCSPSHPTTALPAMQNLTLEALVPGSLLTQDDVIQIAHMPQLLYLAITGYNLSSTKFLGERALLQLKLDHVMLTTGQDQLFLEAVSNLFQLEDLDVSNSPQLAGILTNDQTVWRHLFKLQALNLHNCGLTNLGKTQRKKLHVDISMNPLHCDCILAAAFTENMYLGGQLSSTLCSTPEQYRGKTVSEILLTLKTNCFEGHSSGQINGQGSPPKKENIKTHNQPTIIREDDTKFDNADKDQEMNGESQQPHPSEVISDFEPLEEINDETDFKISNNKVKSVTGYPLDGNEDLGGNPLNGYENDSEHTYIAGEETKVDKNPVNEVSEENKSEKNDAKSSIDVNRYRADKSHGHPISFDDELAKHIADNESNKTVYIVVGVVLAIAVVLAIIFTSLFFYFRRRGHSNIEESSVRYEKQTSSHDNLVKDAKK